MTDTPFRAVVWAAVSTAAQAKANEASLPDQVAKGQALIAARGWKEAHAPLIVAGESRQTVISLRDAEEDIPELKLMLDLAQAGRVNLVVLYAFNRLRGLLDQVARTLAAYGCQIYSITQPVEPLPPEKFNPYISDTSTLVQGASQTFSTMQIADLRRKYTLGMPARLEKGLPLHSIPYGYRKPPGREWDSKAAAVPVEDECEVLLRMMREYLAGQSAEGIAAGLNAEGVPTRKFSRWTGGTILEMLTSPWYAGFVFRNQSKTFTDPRTRHSARKKLPRSEWVLRKGSHAALWSQEIMERILDVRERRKGLRVRVPPHTQPFSGLVVCAACDKRMKSWNPSSAMRVRKRRYVCKPSIADPHGNIWDWELRDQFRPALEAAVQALQLARPSLAPDTDHAGELAEIERSLKACDEKRKRYQRFAGNGLLTEDELVVHLREVDAEKEVHLATRARLQGSAESRARRDHTLSAAEAFLERYDTALNGDLARANADLAEFVESIVIGRHAVKIVILRA